MKYLFLPLIMGLFVQLCSAQITFQSTDLPVAPSTFNNGVDTMPSGVVVGPAGANQTWDYSSVTQHITETVDHQTSAASGYSGSFPTATNAITPDGSTYGFFINTGSAFTGQGLAGDLLGNGSTVVVQFSPTFDLYRFPTQYGGAFGGTYGFQQTASGSSVGQPVNQVRITYVSNYTDSIDGYGTVTTPMGTYDCLRQKRVEYTDTKIEFKLFSFSSWSTADRIYDTTITYIYLAKETEGPVVTVAVEQGSVSRVTYSLIPPAPIADFTANNPYGGTVDFTDESSNSPATYSWTFGDGSTSTSSNPRHTYAANGTYNVCLTVTNATGTDTYCQNVTVNGIFTTSISGDTSLCLDQAMAPNNTYSVTNTAGHNYYWTSTGGGLISPGTNSVNVSWFSAGTDTLVLTECESTGNYCVTDSLVVEVLPTPSSNITQEVCYGDSYLGYSASGVYTDYFTAANGCDSTRTLTLLVLPQNQSSVSMSICPGTSYAGYSTTGVYTDTLTAANGCDSIRTLDLTVLPQISTVIDTTVCYGASYLGYSATGTYYDTLVAANTCDSVRVLNLTVRSENMTTISNSICAGDTLEGYTTSGTYTDQFTDQYGCDSTRVLNLTVRPANVTNFSVSICPGNSYEGYTSAGTYTDTFTDRYGCDSTRTVNLSLQSNILDTVYRQECFGGSYYGYTNTGTYTDTFSSFSCDSIRVLFLTILPQSTQTVSQTICQGESFEGYSAGGTYTDFFTNSNGCDSTRTLQLTVLPTSNTVIDTTICYGSTFEGYGATGTYNDTLVAANTCDSVRVINLTVLPLNLVSVSQTICQGDSYLGYTTAGAHADTFAAANGCDSIRVLNLTVLSTFSTVIDTTICYGTTFEGYGATGTYRDTLQAANTCDSVRVLTLTVLPQNLVNISQTICSGSDFEGYTATGVYTDVYAAANGCDSTRVLDLTVLPVVTTQSFDTICFGDMLYGYDTTGVYTITATGANGCDSVHTLNLFVEAQVVNNVTASICAGDSLLLAGAWQTTAGVYTDTVMNGACIDLLVTELSVEALPNVPVLSSMGDTVSSDVTTADSYYWYLDGALVDSTSGSELINAAEGSYVLTVMNAAGCEATSDTFDLIISSVAQFELTDICSIYPNPTTGWLYINNTGNAVIEVSVYNAVGSLVMQTKAEHGVNTIDLSTADQGIYFVRTTLNGTTQMTKVVLTR